MRLDLGSEVSTSYNDAAYAVPGMDHDLTPGNTSETRGHSSPDSDLVLLPETHGRPDSDLALLPKNQ